MQTFTFISNPVTTTLPLPYDLIEGHQLPRATVPEAAALKRILFTGGLRNMAEYSYGEVNPDGSRRSPNEANWKLFGIVSKNNFETENLELAGNLLQKDLVIGLYLILLDETEGHGFGGNALKIARLTADPSDTVPEVEITREDISEWRDAYERIRKLPAEALIPFRSLETLRSISPQSPLFALGLFAIIESIITHKPHDQFDSLVHQVSTKMALLSKRFTRQLHYTEFRADPAKPYTPTKLWKTLYDYRSCVAHGKRVDFASKELKPLESARKTHQFLLEALKLLLLDLLKEPELIADLKEC